MGKKCPFCGNNLEDGKNVCSSCGKAMEEQTYVGRKFYFSAEMLTVYGKEQLIALQKVLASKVSSKEEKAEKQKILETIVQKVIAKTGFKEAVSPEDSGVFLQEFYDALQTKLTSGKIVSRETRIREIIKPESIDSRKSEQRTEKTKEQPKESPLIPFLKENVGYLMLALGVAFLFTAAILFFRSHWEQYKILVFYGFATLTALLFAGGYFGLYRVKNWSSLIPLTLLLTASLFFPLNFYFGVKAGIIEDHGNRYQVLWLTFAIFVWHAWLLRNTIFTAFSMFVATWALQTTLHKFVPEAWSVYPLYFSIEALILAGVGTYLYTRAEKVKAYFLVGFADILFLYEIFAGISAWDISIFAFVIGIGILIGFAQLRFLEKNILGNAGAWFFSLCLPLFPVLLLRSWEMPFLWPCLTALFVAFFLVFLGCLWKSNPHKETVYEIGLTIPVLTFAFYLLWGSYEYGYNQWPLFLSSVIVTVFYFACTCCKQEGSYVHTASLFSFLAIYSLLQFIPNVNYLYYPFLFLLWGLALTGITFVRGIVDKPWLSKALQESTEACTALVLFFFFIFGQGYYSEQFELLSSGLILISFYYGLMGLYLQRKGMVTASVFLVLVWITLFSYRLSIEWYTYCLYMLIFGLMLLGLGCIFRSRKIVGERGISFLSIAIILTFTIIPFYSGYGQFLWEVKVAILLGFVFFAIRFWLERTVYDCAATLVYFTGLYYIFFWEKCSLHKLPSILESLAFLALLAIVVQKQPAVWQTISGLCSKACKKISYPYTMFGKDNAAFLKVLEYYACAILVFTIAFLVLYFPWYYNYHIKPALITTLLLMACFILLYWIRRNKLYLTCAILAFYVHYFLWMPKDLFPFTYSLFFIPVACALLTWSHIHKGSISEKPTLAIAHATLATFLALPAAFPGIVPSAFVSFFVLAMVFVFYFLCTCYSKKTGYVYISTIFFLIALLVGLFATKTLYGREMTLIMCVCNSIPLGLGWLLLWRRQNRFAYPLFELGILHALCLLVSVLVQGVVDSTTLYTVLVSAMQMAFMACIQMFPSLWPSESEDNILVPPAKALASSSVALFAVAYYLMLAVADLAYPPMAYQYLGLAAVSLVLTLLLQKIAEFYKPLLLINLIAPILAFIHVSDTGTLTAILGVTCILYLLTANYLSSRSVAALGCIYLILMPYSFLMQQKSEVYAFASYAILAGIVLISLSYIFLEKWPKKDFLWLPLKNVAFVNQFVLIALAFADNTLLKEHVYLVILLSFVNAAFLFSMYFTHREHIFAAALYFLLSYYWVVDSWAVKIWEFYTIPPGLILIGVSLYLESKEEEVREWLYSNLYLLGLVLILMPSFIQSYYGWYDHARYEEAGLQNLYHSIFLSVESLALIFIGIYRKRLVLFFTGIIFLISDAALMLFSHIHFGNMPQAVWWAIVGISLIVSAWVMEYYRRNSATLHEMIGKKKDKILQELKTWR